MTRVLLIGQIPETVDLTDPSLPPGLSVDAIRSGLSSALQQMEARGWHGEMLLVGHDETAERDVHAWLAAHTPYDCIVIGAGIRLPPRSLALFERVLNAVHRGAPDSAIAFNTRPDDTADAAARWVAR